MSADPTNPTEARHLAAEKRVGELEAALRAIEAEAAGNSGENTYKMNGKLLRILNTAHDALANGDEANG